MPGATGDAWLVDNATAGIGMQRSVDVIDPRFGLVSNQMYSNKSELYLGKKRFEIACYKNKVLEWRSGAEKDLDNVLQIPNVFLNVSKGQTAPKDDLSKAFGKLSVNEIVLEILNKGDLQVGEKERHAELDRMHAEVIDIVAGKVVDPKTRRVYTTGMIEKALDILSQQGAQAHGLPSDSKTGSGTATPGTPGNKATTAQDGEAAKEKHMPRWTGVVTTKSAKSQALDAIKALIAHQPIPIQRARMRLRVICPASVLKQAVKTAPKSGVKPDPEATKATGTVKDWILSNIETVESQDVLGEEWEVTGFAEPGALKILGDFLSTETRGRGRVEVLDMAVVHEGE
ncbi:hypothetical protein MRB53_038649 [Persea americana]|nr:hypothetical protein MRB53_038649 [Persea americana]